MQDAAERHPQNRRMNRILVVGASLAGLHAARALRDAGFGGTVDLVGAEPHRPYDRPPLSKGFLAGKLDRAQVALERADEALAATWRLGTPAASLDAAGRVLTLADGTRLGFDGLVIATGARARRLPLNDLAGTHVVRTLDDADALREDLRWHPGTVAIIGAGLIGMELAACCRQMGREVVVIEAGAAPMERVLGHDMGEAIAAMHRRHGVDLRTGIAVIGHEKDATGRVCTLALSNGSTIDVAVVAVAIGATPDVDWLHCSGLTLDDGVVCDASCLAAPGIVAAGDIARWPNRRWGDFRRVEHWDNAVRQGRHAALRLLAPGDAPHAPFEPTPWFWSDQYDRKIQLHGSVAPGDAVRVVEGSADDARLLALYHRGNELRGVLSINMARSVGKWRALLEARVPFDTAVAQAA